MKLKTLDLFAGIGGFSLGLESTGGFETIAFCEIEKYPQKVLNKNWPGVPIAQDVTKLTYKDGELKDGQKTIYKGAIDVITGGFPCQDISVAGKQEGIKDGTRSGLWSECARLLGEIRPRYAIFENVTALLSGDSGRWFQRVLFDISEVGYDAEWHCVSASELGAHHHRDRVWIIAYPLRQGLEGYREFRVNGEGLQKTGESIFRNYSKGSITSKIWTTEPELGRVVDGIPDRAHRLKCLGNAVVPQIPELIGNVILALD